jgi:hypothetical protein
VLTRMNAPSFHFRPPTLISGAGDGLDLTCTVLSMRLPRPIQPYAVRRKQLTLWLHVLRGRIWKATSTSTP